MTLTFQSEVRTGRSKLPVRLSGVFVDAAGSVKGLTVLGVLPGVAPTVGSTSALSNFSQRVYVGANAEVGVLDPFWWQSSEVAHFNAEEPTSWTGGAMMCLFTLAKGAVLNDKRWLEDNAQIAAAEAYVEKPVRLAKGGEIGVIVDELNHLFLSKRSVYPLMKLRRTSADRAASVGIRNGAMVFAQDGGMVGVIVASFGGGEFYSVAPIEDVLKWHALRFITEPTLVAPRADEGPESKGTATRQYLGSPELRQLCEV